MKRFHTLARTFYIPLLVLGGIVLFGLFSLLHLNIIATIIIVATIFLGSFELFKDTAISLTKRQFALDYIAILAIIVGLITQEYLVASVIALMIASGRTLEEYGVAQARKSLTLLAERIPSTVMVWKKGEIQEKKNIKIIKKGELILIRKGEVIALDGTLISESGVIDESSLTGEPYPVDKIKDDIIRSGTVNIGDPIVIKVQKVNKDSTYNKIIDMVKSAQNEKAPLVRLADKYSTIFTLITVCIAAFAYFNSRDLTSVFAVLVVATPCPLILATPIALMGGVNAAAKKRIIVKKLASLEALSRTTALVLDKTGTITLGKPRVIALDLHDKSYSYNDTLGISEAIERNSLHPLAKAIVEHAKQEKAPLLHAHNIEEKIGKGIKGAVNNKTYTLSKLEALVGMQIGLFEGKKHIATFTFEDEIKPDSQKIIKELVKKGLKLYMLTGDKLSAAQKVAVHLGTPVDIKAECSPQDKQQAIIDLKKQKQTISMIGDGINDAPALALADVGIVFSNEEQTAASEAADIVFLGGDFTAVSEAYTISQRTIHIALQSIMWGIGVSVVGMLLAAFGLLPPLAGAVTQELIDVAVILNALRASR